MDRRQRLGQRPHRSRAEAYYYSAKAHARLTAALPNAQFVDADLLVNWIRAVKSRPKSPICARTRASPGGCPDGLRVIEPGVRECDAVAAIKLAQYGGDPEFAGDITALPPTILAGENASAPHIMWSDRRFEGRDGRIGIGRGMSPLYCRPRPDPPVGNQPPRFADVENAVLEGMDAVLGAMPPASSPMTSRQLGAARSGATASEGIADRLFHRRRLSAGLGRAHHQLAAGRPHRAGAGPCPSCHSRHVDGWLGHRGQRDYPRHRNGL